MHHILDAPLELPEEILREINNKNESIAYAHTVMQANKDKIHWNQLTLTIFANIHYRNILAEEIRKEKNEIIACLERERKE